jgi:thioredoxin reductase (NADPH)
MISPELVRRYAFFGGLTPDEAACIALCADEVHWPDGTIVFRDGDPATHVFVVMSGMVDMVHHVNIDSRTEAVEVGSTAPGEPFAISAFVAPYRLTATAQCRGAVKAIRVDAEALRALSETNCHLGYTIMRQIARALSERLSYCRIQLAACRPG